MNLDWKWEMGCPRKGRDDGSHLQALEEKLAGDLETGRRLLRVSLLVFDDRVSWAFGRPWPTTAQRP